MVEILSVILTLLTLGIAAVVLAVGMERAASLADVRFDWTFERRYDLSPKVVELVGTLPGLSITKAREILQQTDRIIATFPEVERVFGKIGRVESATDPAATRPWA